MLRSVLCLGFILKVAEGLQVFPFLQIHTNQTGAPSDPLAAFGHVGTIADLTDDGLDEIIVGLFNQFKTDDLGYLAIFSVAKDKSVLTYLNTQYTVTGTSHSGKQWGYSVDGVGDMDSNGYPDFIVTCPDCDATDSFGGRGTGLAWLVFLFQGTIKPYHISNQRMVINSTLLGGISTTRFGHHVTSIGDIDGDGLEEVLISEAPANGGRFHLLYFQRQNAKVTLKTFKTFAPLSADFSSYPWGRYPRGIGDVNGDGITDIAITGGAPDFTFCTVYLMNANGTFSEINMFIAPFDYSILNTNYSNATKAKFPTKFPEQQNYATFIFESMFRKGFASPHAEMVGDYDGDGQLDLLVPVTKDSAEIKPSVFAVSLTDTGLIKSSVLTVQFPETGIPKTPWPSGGLQALQDLNGDSEIEMVGQKEGSGTLTIFSLKIQQKKDPGVRCYSDGECKSTICARQAGCSMNVCPRTCLNTSTAINFLVSPPTRYNLVDVGYGAGIFKNLTVFNISIQFRLKNAPNVGSSCAYSLLSRTVIFPTGGRVVQFNLCIRADNKVRFEMRDKNSMRLSNTLISQRPMQPDRFSDVLLQSDGNFVSLYVHGVLQGMSTLTTNPSAQLDSADDFPVEFGHRSQSLPFLGDVFHVTFNSIDLFKKLTEVCTNNNCSFEGRCSPQATSYTCSCPDGFRTPSGSGKDCFFWVPTSSPSKFPSKQPTIAPTRLPSLAPSASPTTSRPTESPTTRGPTMLGETFAPTVFPTSAPSRAPTVFPTSAPSRMPTRAPTTSAPDQAPLQTGGNRCLSWAEDQIQSVPCTPNAPKQLWIKSTNDKFRNRLEVSSGEKKKCLVLQNVSVQLAECNSTSRSPQEMVYSDNGISALNRTQCLVQTKGSSELSVSNCSFGSLEQLFAFNGILENCKDVFCGNGTCSSATKKCVCTSTYTGALCDVLKPSSESDEGLVWIVMGGLVGLVVCCILFKCLLKCRDRRNKKALRRLQQCEGGIAVEMEGVAASNLKT